MPSSALVAAPSPNLPGDETAPAAWVAGPRKLAHWRTLVTARAIENLVDAFATGLRNPNGLAWEPRTGALWTVVNERDELGSDLVPDYLTSVREGGFYPEALERGLRTERALIGSALEQSNVDIAQEFTQMILAQRGYQANSKTITVSDELLVDTLNLKR